MKQSHEVTSNQAEHGVGQESIAAKLLNKLWS
jgi:hypothetical protein